MNKTRVAIPIWSDRLCTVFDFANHLLIVDLEGGKVLKRNEYALGNMPPLILANRLLNLNVRVLICGAVSRPLASLVSNYGIKIIPFICGDIEEVLHAYITGSLADQRFYLPGCTSTSELYRKGHRGFHGGIK